jgi:ABC-2 type transport system ATP-binding protein
MLIGLLEPTRGKVLSKGTEIRRDIVEFRKQLGYVPEEPNLYSHLSGFEYLELVGVLRGVRKSLLVNKIEELLHLFRLYPHRHGLLASYSKGMRQRILLISAMLDDPNLLILDEPLSGLDATSALIVKILVGELAKRGKAIFYCSHVLEVVEKLCTHLLILRNGKVIAYGLTDEIQNDLGKASLESTFMRLTEDADVVAIAGQIAKIVSSK